MTIHYFSQWGDDDLLWQFFRYKSEGFYIDVGSFDGIHLSNTYSFELQDWTGICVEAFPSYYQLCKEARSNSICIHAACVGDDSLNTVTFYTERLGLLSGIEPQLSDVQSRYDYRGIEFNGFEEIKVPAVTLNSILKEHLKDEMSIDFISIDVEGSELDVLAGLDLKRYRPRVLVLEANSKQERDKLVAYLKPFGYKLGRVLSVNVFFVQTWFDIFRMEMIDVDCIIEAPPHPLGDEHTLHKEPRHLNTIPFKQRISRRLRRVFKF